MKIDLMMNSLPSGGAERVMSLLVNGLAIKNHNIRFITFNEGQAFEISEKVDRIKLHHGKIKNHSIRSLVNLICFYRKKSNRPDALISFLPDNNVIAIITGKILNFKVIVSEHTNHTVPVTKKIKWVRKHLYKYATATTVLTNFDVAYFESLGANVIVMPNPIILPEKNNKFSERSKIILAVGGLDRYKIKGFDSLIQLIEPVLRANNDWSLKIVGHGDKGMRFLKKLTTKLDINKQVSFTGFSKDVPSLMQNAQIYILSSRHEGLPMALMEALSNGMACLAYNCVSGPSDLIQNKVNGILVADQDSEEMKNQIQALIHDENLRKRLADNAKESVMKYDLENILIRWEELIKYGRVS